MLVDEAQITVQGGKGGPGKVDFFPFKSGPCGGDGGNGGDVFFVVNSNLSSLKRFVEKTSFKAENGLTGYANRRAGENGQDLELYVPIGTTIQDIKTGEEVELDRNNPRILTARGG